MELEDRIDTLLVPADPKLGVRFAEQLASAEHSATVRFPGPYAPGRGEGEPRGVLLSMEADRPIYADQRSHHGEQADDYHC